MGEKRAKFVYLSRIDANPLKYNVSKKEIIPNFDFSVYQNICIWMHQSDKNCNIEN